MTRREAAEHFRQQRQLSSDTTHREALQLAEQALVAQDRQTRFLKHWQAWADQGDRHDQK